MKWNCDLIQDLLPLYEEGLCSPSSRQAVEEHLGECDACRRLAAPLPIEAPPETPAADRAVKRSIKKVRRRWLLSRRGKEMSLGDKKTHSLRRSRPQHSRECRLRPRR